MDRLPQLMALAASCGGHCLSVALYSESMEKMAGDMPRVRALQRQVGPRREGSQAGPGRGADHWSSGGGVKNPPPGPGFHSGRK